MPVADSEYRKILMESFPDEMSVLVGLGYVHRIYARPRPELGQLLAENGASDR